jgi:peptide subunit release factor 1 (eRF1)
MHADRLARFESPDFPVLSVYVNRDSSHASVRARICDLLKPLRLHTDLDHDAQMSLRTDLETVVGLADRIDSDRAPATAMFACQGGGLFEYIPLSTQVWDTATLSDRPYLRPLRTVRQGDRVLAVIVDRKHAWLYCGDGTNLRSLEVIEESESHKSNFGGFSGYEERGARSHAEALERRHFRVVADRLFELQRELGFGQLVVGGHEETISRFEAFLHPYVRDLLIGSFVIDPHTMTDAEISRHADALLADARNSTEFDLAAKVSGTADEGGRAVLGLTGVLEAVNRGAVDHLVVAGPFVRDGVRCSTCNRLDRNDGRCQACGSDTTRVDDIIDAAMEQVLRTGGRADQLSVASSIDVHGVGALVRFSVRVA